MRKLPTRRIAILLGQDLGHCREVLAGILEYEEARHASWQFRDGPPDRRLLQSLERWKPDGIIGHFFDPSFARTIMQRGVPCVSTTRTLPVPELSTIDVDNLAVGALAADYFLERGFRSFAYFGSEAALFSAERFQGFEQRLRAARQHTVWFKAEFRPQPLVQKYWDHLGKPVDRWLLSLPRCTALFVSNDLPARHLTLACMRLGLSVPDDIAILGVDNDEAECRMAIPSLSSIAIPARRIGYEAARMLDGLLHRGRGRSIQVRLPPVSVIERQSTELFAVEDSVVQKALQFIAGSFTERIDVGKVAKAAGASRRTLETRVRRLLSKSVLGLIQSVKIGQARRLLVETDLSITDVADRAGFSSLRQLEIAFGRSTGQTPKAFRGRGKP